MGGTLCPSFLRVYALQAGVLQRITNRAPKLRNCNVAPFFVFKFEISYILVRYPLNSAQISLRSFHSGTVLHANLIELVIQSLDLVVAEPIRKGILTISFNVEQLTCELVDGSLHIEGRSRIRHPKQ